MFTRYLALGNVRHLEAELAGDGVTLPVRQRVNGSGSYGGGAFTRGQLYKILSNPIYIGRIAHGAKHYAGQHPAIIDTEQWDAVQAKLADNRQGHRSGVHAASPSLLAGRVVDPAGEPLIASHTTKEGRRYRYYVGQALHHGTSRDGSRFPARELETAVTTRLAEAFDDPMALAASCSLSLTAAGLSNLHDHAAATMALLHRRDRRCIQGLVDRVVVHTDRVDVVMRVAAISGALRLAPTDTTLERFTLSAAVVLTRTGRAMKLVHDNGTAVGSAANPALVRLLVKARRWWTLLREGEVDVTALAAREGVQPSYLTRVVRLAFVSPEVTAAALRGDLRVGIDAAALVAPGSVPGCWRQQAMRCYRRDPDGAGNRRAACDAARLNLTPYSSVLAITRRRCRRPWQQALPWPCGPA